MREIANSAQRVLADQNLILFHRFFHGSSYSILGRHETGTSQSEQIAQQARATLLTGFRAMVKVLENWWAIAIRAVKYRETFGTTKGINTFNAGTP